MLFKTHIAFGLLSALVFLPYVNNEVVFVLVVLGASVFPDIDFSNSSLGSKWFFRPLQIFVKHRGVLHGLLFCFIASLLFSLFLPVLAFPFFLGCAGHLILDSLNVDGINAFWPFGGEVKGFVRTGSYAERVLFAVLIGLNVFFVFERFVF